MRRDLRDPQAVGLMLAKLKSQGLKVLNAADELPAYAIPNYASNETCIEKYGKPGEAPPRFEEIRTR